MRPTVFIVTLLSALLASCATVNSLPQSPEHVDLHATRFQQGYWPRYAASVTITGRPLSRVYQAARAALVANDFALVRDDPSQGVLMGEHGPTLFYWNVMAGIYLIQQDEDVLVKVVSVGSKDIGFIELQAGVWPRQLLGSMATSLQSPPR